MSQLLHVYVSAPLRGENMSASRRCQQLLWQVAASGGWSDEVLVLGVWMPCRWPWTRTGTFCFSRW